jgi:hypothetical protein
VFLFANFKTSAQVSVNIISRWDTLIVPQYKTTEKNDEKSVFLRMNFGSSEIINPDEILKLKQQTIKKIQLLCTDYPDRNFSENLNRNRLLALYLKAPYLFNNNTIKWEIVFQTGADSKTCYNFRHGFIITYQSEELLNYGESQKKYLEQILNKKMPLSDSVIIKVLERHSEWDNMLIVCDMTQSMSPYIAEILLWYNLNFDKKKNQTFVFFNDGNNMPDEKKRIGETGGIYFCNKQNIDSILNTAVLTMEKGTGGDGPENDVEAVLDALKKYPEKQNVVLIADNLSTMRDYCLIKQINKPVKIILCGITDGINTEYLDFAYKTGGSVYTIESDIMNLVKLREGETIKIGQQYYKITDGRFLITDEKN